MGLVDAFTICLRKFATFSGRASRSEFWLFAPLWTLGAAIFAHLLESFLVLIALLLPVLSASERRSGDAGRNPIWIGVAFGFSFAGLGLFILGLAPSGGHPPIWPTVLGLLTFLVSILSACGLLLLPLKNGPNPHEVTS